MPRLQAKNFAAPDGVRDLPMVHIDTVDLDDVHVGYCRFEAGWKWSRDMAPILGVASCQIRHLGYSVSGVMHVAMDDGTVLEIGPHSVFEIPPGHDKWVVGDDACISVEWGGSGRAFSEAVEEAGSRTLATVLFTDIVDSTKRLREIGDRAWRELLAAHDARLRETLNVYRGREVDTTGDGFLAIFDSPTRAVRCAERMTAAARSIGLEIRAGVHTGEVEVAGENVRGIAVHTAARIVAQAGASEVLVSSTTAALIEGSGIAVEEAGTYELKGLSGTRQLFRVAAGAAAPAG